MTYIAYTKHLTYVYEVYKVLVHYTDTGFNVCCAMTVVEVKKSKQQMGVEPKIGGKTPKWMVFFMETPIKMDDLGGFPTPIFGSTPHLLLSPLNVPVPKNLSRTVPGDRFQLLHFCSGRGGFPHVNGCYKWHFSCQLGDLFAKESLLLMGPGSIRDPANQLRLVGSDYPMFFWGFQHHPNGGCERDFSHQQ